jgi:hypothetical protein
VSKRKLPLDSPNWWLIEDALKHRTQRTGSDWLARADFNQVLKADQLPALARRADGHRELLAAAHWGDLRIGAGLRVMFSRKLGKPPPGYWFYVWKPCYEKIFGPVTTSAEPRPRSQEVPIKRGKKPVHDRADLQSAALGLALQRKQGAPEKKPTDVVGELREWCKRNKRKVPADSTLYDIVAAAFQIKRTLKS